MEKDFSESKNTNVQRKFCDFQEISFPSTERHNDMTQVIKYLKEYELEYAFKEIIGLEAKTSQTDWSASFVSFLCDHFVWGQAAFSVGFK